MDLLFLAYCRFSPMLLFLPIAPFRGVPLTVRGLLCLALALALTPWHQAGSIQQSEDLFRAVSSELFLGTVLAGVIFSFFGAIQKYLSVVDSQAGFLASSVFDPSAGHFNSVFARIISAALVAAFFYLEIYHYVILAFALMMNTVPLGSAVFFSDDWYIHISSIFTSAFLLFGPIIFLLLIVDVLVAVISRSMPQAQVYFVALPVKVMIAILLMAAVTQFMSEPLKQSFLALLDIWSSVLVVDRG